MSKERELLIKAVEWMHELKYLYANTRDSGDYDLLELIADINKIEKLLNHPEQESFMFKDRKLIGSLIAHDDMYKKGYERGFAIARKDYKQKVINAFGADDE